MAVYTNQSGGMLILPGGTEVKAGESADISADDAKNVGVQQWIKRGALVAKARAKAKADPQE